MKKVKLINLPVEWKRGNGLRKSDLEIDGEYKCVLYGELFTKHKNVLIDSVKLSRTNKIGSTRSKSGDILVPGTSTAVKRDMILAREIDEDGVFLGGDINIIRPPKDLFAKKFIAYYFETIDAYEQLEGYINGATGIIHISNTGLKNLKIPLPSIHEQQLIVAILDEAFAAIAKAKANAEQNLKNAKELFESYLQGVFENKGKGWEEKTLGDMFVIGSSKRIMEKDWTVDGVPFYGGKEIVKLAKFGFVVSNSYISEEKYYEYASKYDMPQYDDILITARGTIGIGYIVQQGDKFYYKDGNIISMRAKMPTNTEFILYALKSKPVNDQLTKLTGATVSHLPIEKAKLLVLKTPNFSTQNTVVEKIKEIETETKKLEAIYKQKINDLEELKKSVLQKAFSGELKNNAEVTKHFSEVKV